MDEELLGLPERYRRPLVLYCLESRSVQETAQQLGCPAGTVKTRLARGRERLRARSQRRGVEFSVSLLGTILAAEYSSAMPVVLVSTTLRQSLLVAAGAAMADLPTPVGGLAEGVLSTLGWIKLKMARCSSPW